MDLKPQDTQWETQQGDPNCEIPGTWVNTELLSTSLQSIAQIFHAGSSIYSAPGLTSYPGTLIFVHHLNLPF